MANERLGIYEELEERRTRFKSSAVEMRRRIVAVGPANNGAYAQLRCPFRLKLKIRSGGYYRRHPDKHRTIYPEAAIGASVIQVVQAVCLETDLTPGQLFAPDHSRVVAWPRHVAIWAVDRYCPEFSTTEIAYMFSRDHTTVKYAIEQTNERMHHRTEVRDLIGRVRDRLTGV